MLSNINKNFKPIGLAIKKAREEQNISISFLSEALKINEDYIIAIEKGDNSSLPETVYVKAMLKKIFERLNIEKLESEDLLPKKENPTNVFFLLFFCLLTFSAYSSQKGTRGGKK